MGMFQQKDTQEISTVVFYMGLFGVVWSFGDSAYNNSLFTTAKGKRTKNLLQKKLSKAPRRGHYVSQFPCCIHTSL